MEHFNEVITWLFLIANTGRIIAYVPQLVAAWNCKNGASSVSRLTWGYFAFAHLAGVLYGSYVVHDPKMAWMFSGNLGVCVLLVGIVTWKKMAHARSMAVPRPASHAPFASPWGRPVCATASAAMQDMDGLNRTASPEHLPCR